MADFNLETRARELAEDIDRANEWGVGDIAEEIKSVLCDTLQAAEDVVRAQEEPEDSTLWPNQLDRATRNAAFLDAADAIRALRESTQATSSGSVCELGSEDAATRKDAGTASVEAEVPVSSDPHECCTTCGVNMNAWRCPDCHGSPNPACVCGRLASWTTPSSPHPSLRPKQYAYARRRETSPSPTLAPETGSTPSSPATRTGLTRTSGRNSSRTRPTPRHSGSGLPRF
ncbi:hypothetical protein LCGC14_1740720 [marine sediment metagenome]|uniref:Uncharacterized protein n=1 Tax=marine sediment metagenome TaxID=412755 RepID=A0A0F9H6W4_9ZZZZ